MSNNKLKLKWASKLLKTDNFIVVTDVEAGMLVPVNQDSFEDQLVLASQLAALRRFREALNEAIDRLETQAGVKPKKRNIKVKKTGRKQNVKVNKK